MEANKPKIELKESKEPDLYPFKNLVVCPLSILYSWKEQIETFLNLFFIHFLLKKFIQSHGKGKLTCMIYYGSNRKIIGISELSKYDVVKFIDFLYDGK